MGRALHLRTKRRPQLRKSLQIFLEKVIQLIPASFQVSRQRRRKFQGLRVDRWTDPDNQQDSGGDEGGKNDNHRDDAGQPAPGQPTHGWFQQIGQDPCHSYRQEQRLQEGQNLCRHVDRKHDEGGDNQER